MEKFKVIFDTNLLWVDDEKQPDKHLNLVDVLNLIKFINENKINEYVSLAIPEMVIEERIYQKLYTVEKTAREAIAKLDSLNGYGIESENILPKIDFKTKIAELTQKQVEESGLQIIKTPEIQINLLCERALNKIKPFEGRTDKGFKDTVIWFSLTEDAKKNEQINYLLCTKNVSDFPEESLAEEFKQISNKRFKVFSGLENVKEFFDNEFILRLKLKELHETIQNDIKMKLGDIIVEFNKFKFDRNNSLNLTTRFNYWNFETSSTSNGTISEPNPIIGYSFKEINFRDINKIDDDTYSILIDLEVSARHRADGNIDRSMGLYEWQFSRFVLGNESYLTSLNYNVSTKQISSISFSQKAFF